MALQPAPTQEQREWTANLVNSVESDDLAFCLYWCETLLDSGGVVDWPSSSTSLTPLQTVVSTHGRRRVRKIIVEVLLLSGAILDARVLELAEQGGNREVIDTLAQWNQGGRAKATFASELLQIGAHQSEERIFYEGLGVEGPEAADAEQQPADALGSPEDHLVKADLFTFPRGPELLDSTTSPAPNGDADSSRHISPSVDPNPSRPPSPFVPHRLCISNIDSTMTESALIDILTRVAGRIGNARLITTNSTPPTQTAYIDVGSTEACERIKESWDGTHVNGRPLDVVFVQDQSRKNPAPHRRGRSWSRSTSRSRNSYQHRQPDERRDTEHPSQRRQRSPSPRRRSHSRPPPRRSGSRRSSISSRRRSPSPPLRRRSPSPPPRRRSLSPRRSSGPPRPRSPLPRRRPRSPSPRNRHRSPPPSASPSPTKHRSTDDLGPVFVSGIPPSMAERQLYDLASAVGEVDQVRIRHGTSHVRYGFVYVLSWADYDFLIDHINRTTFDKTPELHARPLTGSRPPQNERERPYRTMKLNLRPPADDVPADLHITHLPPHTTSEDVVKLFASVRLHVRHVEVEDSVDSTFPHSFVTLKHHGDCLEAIRRLDGVLLRGSALCIEWSIPRVSQPPHPFRPTPPFRRPRTASPRPPSPSQRQPLPLSPFRQASPPPTISRQFLATIAIHRVPNSMAERQLYDLVSTTLAEVVDVRVLHGKGSRFAFVELKHSSDVSRVISALDGHQVGPGHRLALSRYDPDRTSTARHQHADRRPPYRGVALNIQTLPDHSAPRLLFSHVPSGVGEKEFRAFLLQASMNAGRIKMIQTWQNTKSVFVDLASMELCRKALQALDGAELQGHALLVMWASNTLDRPQKRLTDPSPSRPSSTPDPAPHPPPTGPQSSILDASCTATSSLSLSADAALAKDISRLECLNLSREDVDLIQKIWKPFRNPPTDNFTRSMEICASFGYLSPSEAKTALELPPLYDDPAQQARYELFLKAQTGESRERYQAFLAQLARFNSSNLEFASFAQEVARTASPSPPPQPRYVSDPSSKEYTVKAAEVGPKAPPGEREQSFEVSDRVKRAFSR